MVAWIWSLMPTALLCSITVVYRVSSSFRFSFYRSLAAETGGTRLVSARAAHDRVVLIEDQAVNGKVRSRASRVTDDGEISTRVATGVGGGEGGSGAFGFVGLSLPQVVGARQTVTGRAATKWNHLRPYSGRRSVPIINPFMTLRYGS